MYCKVCGAKISDPSAAYCSNCGHSLRESGLLAVETDIEDQEQTIKLQEQRRQMPTKPIAGQQEQRSERQPGTSNVQGVQPSPGMNGAFSTPQTQAPQHQMQPEKKKSSVTIWIVLISVITALLVVVGVGLFLYFNHSKAKAIDQFKTRVSGFEGIKSQYDLGKFQKEYTNILSRCNECIEEKNVNVIDVLVEQMEDVKNNVVDNNNEEIDKCKKEIETLQNDYIKENERLEVENSVKQADALVAEQKYKDAYEFYEKALGVLRKQEKGSKDDTEVGVSRNKYYFWDSDIRYLTKEELSVYTAKELRIIRNEIYARHGRKFTSKDLQEYFDCCDWYNACIEAKDFDDEAILSELEMANVKLIQKVEKEKK